MGARRISTLIESESLLRANNLHSLASVFFTALKPGPEKHQHQRRRDRRNHPDGKPVMARPSHRRSCVVVNHAAANPRTHKHSDAIGNEGDQALRGGTERLRRFLIDVNLSGDEEEVVTNAVHDDAGV